MISDFDPLHFLGASDHGVADLLGSRGGSDVRFELRAAVETQQEIGDAVDERIAIVSLLKSAQVFARMLYYPEQPDLKQMEQKKADNPQNAPQPLPGEE